MENSVIFLKGDTGMYYINELSFLCEILRKSFVNTAILSPEDSIAKVMDTLYNPVLSTMNFFNITVGEYTGKVEPFTLYKSSDALGFSYMYMLLPDTEKPSFLFIGPFLNYDFSSRQILEIAERCGVDPKNQQIFNKLYDNIPIIPENSNLYIVVDIFCERMWRNASFSIVDVQKEWQFPVSPINNSAVDDSDIALINMKAMEKRYEYENELMQAVSLGQIHKVDMLLGGFNIESFEKRTADVLRNMKNYCIIMNTLLRKAAENGGVHPIYLDRVSSGFAQRIEQLLSTAEGNSLMREMFRSYCRLVRKHSMKDYSPIVQKTIVIIESDLSSNLTLSTLASRQNLSAGYLSTIFRKETGKTITEYIREKRIKHAAFLLSTTHLQIQTVALHCGIMDVQYFSKTFKKQMGKTPKEYREAMKQTTFK